ncbi:hypothetical protein KAR28_02380 [Candidatus Parcubacteria bacterium]|nr:hypothetical protein [Candidatus Parcubacteria bacterium]
MQKAHPKIPKILIANNLLVLFLKFFNINNNKKISRIITANKINLVIINILFNYKLYPKGHFIP